MSKDKDYCSACGRYTEVHNGFFTHEQGNAIIAILLLFGFIGGLMLLVKAGLVLFS